MHKRQSAAWRRYLRFWGANVTADVNEELEFHIASRAEELVADGLSAGDARAQALREFGDYRAVQRQVRDLDSAHSRWQRTSENMSQLSSDLRYCLRSLRRSPGFAAVVIVTLSLGIGLNSTIFSLVNAYLFRPQRLPNAERLIVIGNTQPLLKEPHELPYRDLQAYRELHTTFEDLAGFYSTSESLNEGTATDRLYIERTTGNYFTTLQVPMVLGRSYDSTASVRGIRVVVLSHALWTRRFAFDSSIVGRTIRLGGNAHQVIGVAVPSFRGFAPMISSDAWAPIDETPAVRETLLNDSNTDWMNVIGRLREGVDVRQAGAALHARAVQLQQRYPETNKEVEPIVVLETRSRPVLAIAGPIPLLSIVMLGLTLMVLAVACANVASLLLARGATRHGEFALRSALGASRWRLTRMALFEVALLSIGGCIGAVLLAKWSTARLGAVRMATDVPLLFDFTPDWRVFAFTLGAAVITTVLAGLLPALRNASADPHDALVAGVRSTDRAQQRVRSIIVVAQVAASVVVLIVAGLFARSMRAAQNIDLGFATKNVLMAQFDLELTGYDSSRSQRFQTDFLGRVRGLPGVRSAALTARIPLGYSNNSQKVVTDEQRADPAGGMLIFMNTVSPDYFRTAGPALVRGREFTEVDNAAAPHVAVINEVMAKRLWPGQDPLGKTFDIPANKEVLQVVGVARDAQYMFVGEPPRPFFWTAVAQHPRRSAFVVMATSRSPESLVPALRDVVRAVDPNVPLFEVRSMEDHLRNGRAMLGVRIGALFGMSFAVLALVLAGVGVYGLVSYGVSQRTREIGIRIAVGATATNVMTLVIRQGVILALAGITLGALGAFGATRLLASLLYGVGTHDPLTFTSGAAILAVIATVASWVPARRASRLDPVRALRTD